MHAVHELGKPSDTACSHLIPALTKRTDLNPLVGCSIYSTRPASCVAYVCYWLGESRADINGNSKRRALLDCDRPDLTGCIVDVGKMAERDCFVIRETTDGASRSLVGQVLVQRLNRYLPVVLVRNLKRKAHQ